MCLMIRSAPNVSLCKPERIHILADGWDCLCLKKCTSCCTKWTIRMPVYKSTCYPMVWTAYSFALRMSAFSSWNTMGGVMITRTHSYTNEYKADEFPWAAWYVLYISPYKQTTGQLSGLPSFLALLCPAEQVRVFPPPTKTSPHSRRRRDGCNRKL